MSKNEKQDLPVKPLENPPKQSETKASFKPVNIGDSADKVEGSSK